ncbi:TetR/AcrR family transcriptional regulator [Tomitella fengzijianii]|uniref:TetR/AcrR family transcriptional regulator n=1 Tax=Tomitella fengzijianii TaxID=2597660 RepID=UPI00131DDECD|nr:TetR/AcrR family transcriptional regulator [Tomitella fengzijianii]
MPTETATKAERKRQLMLRAATELFAVHGLAGTSMRMIATSIGILPGSLYKYVDSKDALLQEIVLGHLRAVHAEFRHVLNLSLPPAQELGELIRRSLILVQRDPHSPQICRNEEGAIRRLAGHAEIRSLAAANHRLWVASIERGVAEGAYRPSINPAAAYELIKDGIWLTGRWFTPSEHYSAADLSVECVEFYLNALAR